MISGDGNTAGRALGRSKGRGDGLRGDATGDGEPGLASGGDDCFGLSDPPTILSILNPIFGLDGTATTGVGARGIMLSRHSSVTNGTNQWHISQSQYIVADNTNARAARGRMSQRSRRLTGQTKKPRLTRNLALRLAQHRQWLFSDSLTELAARFPRIALVCLHGGVAFRSGAFPWRRFLFGSCAFKPTKSGCWFVS